MNYLRMLEFVKFQARCLAAATIPSFILLVGCGGGGQRRKHGDCERRIERSRGSRGPEQRRVRFFGHIYQTCACGGV